MPEVSETVDLTELAIAIRRGVLLRSILDARVPL